MAKKTKIVKTSRFDIDFFEFSFLVEACIPPRPIARMYFWGQVIDKYYHVLTPDERKRLYEWINRNPCFEDSLAKGDSDCLLFNYRYNPDNQYQVMTVYKGVEETKECFKIGETFYLSTSVSVASEYIIGVIKIENNS